MMLDLKADEEVKQLCDNISYARIPLPKYRIPRFEVSMPSDVPTYYILWITPGRHVTDADET